ncbi:MAG: glycosyl transferase [Desulfuromonadaceae bacterium GWC2_58_13]|nr:MAG: glycosyl transferase [Desulfuromonadaceae bacterium GWC2_58_13]
MKLISVIVPVYNEAENLGQLVAELQSSLSPLICPHEILFVDDGSTDESLAIIRALAAEHSQIQCIAFEKNTGQSAALYAGFQQARGDVVITLDADLQNDPADIPVMLRYYGDYDMITGWRKNRRDPLSKKIASKVGNSFRNWMTRETIHDTGCSLKIMRADMLKKIKMFRGLHRFLPTLMRLEGARVIEVPVNHRPRLHGVSKYTNWRRGIEGFQDVLAVQWMQKRNLRIKIRESHE